MSNKSVKKNWSPEEKEDLIDLYEASGQSMRQWCEKTGLPLSTLSSWLRRRAKKTEEVKFISLSPETDPVEEEKEVREDFTLSPKGEAKIVIELHHCEIYLGDGFLSKISAMMGPRDV